MFRGLLITAYISPGVICLFNVFMILWMAPVYVVTPPPPFASNFTGLERFHRLVDDREEQRWARRKAEKGFRKEQRHSVYTSLLGV